MIPSNGDHDMENDNVLKLRPHIQYYRQRELKRSRHDESDVPFRLACGGYVVTG